jgi:hypothetical protein
MKALFDPFRSSECSSSTSQLSFARFVIKRQPPCEQAFGGDLEAGSASATLTRLFFQVLAGARNERQRSK